MKPRFLAVSDYLDVQTSEIFDVPGCSECPNHGRGPAFWNPQDVLEALKSRPPEQPWPSWMASIPRRSDVLSIPSASGSEVLWISRTPTEPRHPRRVYIY